ncbi:ABC transporter substrate-binding protein [Bradyrhizobium canariense]|uniref:ABC-type nitrate/sulfonate/bicarbonate transport system, substrate-binding protein n=1 Tax=Bradyrhizobium canariense TaxID=255045 RepID=A0A1H1ZLA6_9BRAD|nr:ABC transporter substrate-binding protein [Bradyrhizobium canariense]SDT34222.1 ABC-type nitrate/sulfonate/bicarbonate transport system, substrate-binding protein [Bradyrhizobium canariense]
MHKLTVATVARNYYNLPLWIGQEQNFFREQDLDVTLNENDSVDVVTACLRRGEAQLARGITEHVILDREAGGSLEIVAGSINKLPFSLICKASIKTIKQLKGKVIGASSVEAGSSSLIMEILAQEGLKHPDDYTIRAVGPMMSRWELLKTGEIDGGLQGVPMNFIALDAGFNTLIEPRDRFPDFQFSSLNADARWAAANREILVRFLQACLKAHDWYYANRELSSDLAAYKMKLDRDYALRAWDECVAAEIMPRDAKASIAAVQTLIEVSGLIRALSKRTGSHAEDYINPSYLDDASKRHRLLVN